MKFGFEDLEVWKKSIEFADQVIDIIESLDTNRKHFRLIEQLEAASTSIAMNIAEGKGRYSKNDIHDVRDGANTEYEEASPMQIPIVKKEIVKFYADYGITHESLIYEEHENARSDHQLFELGLRPQPNIKDDMDMYKAYQGYCRFMPGGVLFLNYWKRCNGFPEKVQLMMREHWVEEVEFLKSLIDEGTGATC